MLQNKWFVFCIIGMYSLFSSENNHNKKWFIKKKDAFLKSPLTHFCAVMTIAHGISSYDFFIVIPNAVKQKLPESLEPVAGLIIPSIAYSLSTVMPKGQYTSIAKTLGVLLFVLQPPIKNSD